MFLRTEIKTSILHTLSLYYNVRKNRSSCTLYWYIQLQVANSFKICGKIIVFSTHYIYLICLFLCDHLSPHTTASWHVTIFTRHHFRVSNIKKCLSRFKKKSLGSSCSVDLIYVWSVTNCFYCLIWHQLSLFLRFPETVANSLEILHRPCFTQSVLNFALEIIIVELMFVT